MKIIGIVGGVSSESSTEYYRLINREVRLRLGAGHSAELVMYSLDFQPIAQLQLQQRWREAGDFGNSLWRQQDQGSLQPVVV